MIRLATTADFDFAFGLYMHPEVNPYLLYEPMDSGSFRPIYQDLIDRGIKYIYEVDGRRTGMFKLYAHTYRASHVAYLGGLAIDPALSGKGHGLKLIHEILQLAQAKSFARVELSVAVINEKAAGLYLKCGFQQEGILRKYTYLKSEDRYLDEILMSYIL